ncbi:NAD(P)H-binding protein, partial [uncultured Desulfuromusa sp.]|uniref:NAD(P)H-binding protein n=1 Tax=uncultured Desulfuromusa sp. TaxID=219183 RepID=UPI002AA93F34
MMRKKSQPIFVAGATGYIGGRLLPRLLDAGYPVVALARAPEKLKDRPWAQHANLTIVKGDVLDSESLAQAVSGCRAAYYLVHSMNPGVEDFSRTDRIAARNMAAVAAEANLEQIVYLSGLGEEESELSHHLQSRTEVGHILREGSVPTTILRAAMIIGSGSASLNSPLSGRPITGDDYPTLVDTPCQPIGVRNVLHYLVGCLENSDVVGETFDIGQPEVIN